MYNRYIPQADGSYRRRSVPENPSRPYNPSPLPEPPREERPPEPECCEPPADTGRCSRCPQGQKHPRKPEPPRNSRDSAGGFLKNLLPGNFDTEDLLVVVLLLLMSGDCREDRNIPLLTLALYLFL